MPARQSEPAVPGTRPGHAVGQRLHLRLGLAGFYLRGLRDRHLRQPHRRLAGIPFPADPVRAQCPGTGTLPEETAEDALIDLIESLRGKAEQATAAQKPDPARFVPIEAVQELMASHHTDRSERAKDRAAAKDALARGFITPAMKGWATALCTQDEASFDSFMASSAPAYAHLMAQAVPNNPPPSSTAEFAQSDTAAAVCAQLGLKPGALSK